MRILVATTVALLFAGSALAQQNPPPADQAQLPSAGTPGNDQSAPGVGKPGLTSARQPNSKRVACMDKARQQGLRGPQLRDAVQLCVQEARLSCTKQAIEKNVPAQQRRDFMRSCAG